MLWSQAGGGDEGLRRRRGRAALTGTEPDVLAKVLQKRYRGQGLVEYRGFRSVEELRGAGQTVAVMKFNALQDHCVAGRDKPGAGGRPVERLERLLD